MTDAGGAILVDGGKLTVTGATFTENTANNGAAIGTSRSKTTAMTISGCTFTSNKSTQNGGGVYIQNGVKNETDSIVISGCTFRNNVADKASGAAIYIRTNSSATITDVAASGGKWGYKGEIYATTGTRTTFGGTVTVSGTQPIFVTGNGTTAIVNYRTDAEKAAWEAAITIANKATITYVAK
jgi:predicted outer membrane repeat protein